MGRSHSSPSTEKITMLRVVLLSLLAAGSNAFMSPVRPARLQSTARHVIMSEDEIAAVLSKANNCVESECSVDTTDDLITELKAQQKVLRTRLDAIMNTVAHLEQSNESGERKKEDVAQIVKDLMRTFSVQDGKFAMGFSGDIGDGPSTAYDALPPKPWKADS